MIRKLFFITLASLARVVPAGNAAALSDGQRHGCGVLVDPAKKLLALAPRTYQQRDAGHLPIHLRHHHTYLTTVEAFVDPDPEFIHVGR